MTRIEFIAGNMDHNFKLLLVHFGLLASVDATEAEVKEAETRVKELIPRFSLSRNRMKPTEIKVGEGSYKSGLFVLFLSNLSGKKLFVRSQQERSMTEEFFTPEIISDAKDPKLSNHPVVRAILSDGSLAIKVENPSKEEVQEEKTPPVEDEKKPKKEKKKKKKGNKKEKKKKKNKKK